MRRREGRLLFPRASVSRVCEPSLSGTSRTSEISTEGRERERERERDKKEKKYPLLRQIYRSFASRAIGGRVNFQESRAERQERNEETLTKHQYLGLVSRSIMPNESEWQRERERVRPTPQHFPGMGYKNRVSATRIQSASAARARGGEATGRIFTRHIKS